MNTTVMDTTNTIVLTAPIASHPDLERLNLFAGRHMGEEEFERSQAYVDKRLAPLLGSSPAGIVSGLNVRESRDRRSLTISPGLAIANNGQALNLFHPMRQNWQDLIDNYLRSSQAADGAGIYYLLLQRSEAYVDADPKVRPCQRDEFDPSRDAQRVLVGSLSLLKLGIAVSAVSTFSQETIENWVAANNIDGNLTASIAHAVPLALVAVENAGTDSQGQAIHNVPWMSQEAGRYMAAHNSGYHLLFRQVSQAFRRTLFAAQSRPVTESVGDYFENNLSLDFLAASGQFPAELIEDIDSTSPRVRWLPEHLGVDMVAVPESNVQDLLQRHLARRVIDLRQASHERLRILLALGENDYRPNILDFPQTDGKLAQDVYRYFQRAYKMWMSWMQQYQALYFVVDDDVLEPSDLVALDLPEAIAAPQLPQDFYQEEIDEADAELGRDEDGSSQYPYNLGRPAYPDFYRAWGLVTEDNATNEVVLPPALPSPEKDGLVIQYAVAENELEAIDNQVREARSRLELTRDYLLLQRQQLDNQTVSLAALAGGVAGDGSGMQVARWLPFAELKRATLTEPTDDVVTPKPLYTIQEKSHFTHFAGVKAASNAVKASKVGSSAKSSRFNLSAKTVTSSKNLMFASILRKTPNVFSTLQFNLNNNRLDKIAEAPKEALTRPAFDAKEFRFGVLEHIRPEIQEYKKALRGMSELSTTLTSMFSSTEANSLRNTFNKIGTPASLTDLEINLSGTNQGELERAGPRIYEALFNCSKILTEQIAYMESRYNRIEALLEGRLRARIKKENQLEKLAALIEKASQALDNIDKRRVEFLGDYGVAQRLLEENWRDVHDQHQARSRILTKGLKGVYFVRERQASVSQTLADPLELRYGQADDIVPGCDWDSDPNLPEELEDFFDTLMEVPMADWASLKGLAPLLPSIPRLEYIEQIRQVRFQAKTSKKRFASRVDTHQKHGGMVKASLYNVRLQSQHLLGHMAAWRFPLTLTSAKARAEASVKVMSLEDLISGTRGELQRQSQTLARRLEQAAACLLEKLDELPPSLRLQWAQMAEDDRLPVENVARWPGLERAEKSDFTTTRTLAELVEWMFRQLHKKSSSDARAALRNLLRALVIQSALGDPAEILQGQVHIPPRKFSIGEPLRLKLNQRTLPGTQLQLLDPKQRLVAMLKVDDDDDKGTLAQITRVTRKFTAVTTQFRVVASKSHRRLR